jgi:multidrug resistance protein, MATE family
MPRTWRSLIALAWPAMATGFVRVAMRTVDLIVVGIVIGAVGVAAVGIADAATRIVLMAALGLSAGTMATVSQRTGAGDKRGADAAATQTILIALAMGLTATALGIPLARPFFQMLGAEAAVVDAGAIYLQIVIATAAFRTLSIMLSRVFAAAGDTRTPMYVRVSATIVNIALTVVLVPGLGPAPALGVAGAAIGTAVGNVLSGAILVGLLASSRFRIGFSRDGLRDFATGAQILTIGAPQVAERMLFAVADIPLNGLILTFGTEANAGFQVGRRAQFFARVPAIGLGVAASAFVGMKIGARNIPESVRYGREAIWLAGLIGLGGAILLAIFAGPIALAFGGRADPGAFAAMTTWVRVLAVATAFKVVYAVLRYAMQGAGETRLPLYASPVGIVGFMLGFSYLAAIPLGLGIVGVYLGVVLDGVVRTTMLGHWWHGRRWLRAIPEDPVPAEDVVAEATPR